MPVGSLLIDATLRELHYVPSSVDFKAHGNILVVETQAGAHGVWKSVTRTTSGTTAVVTPIPGGSLQITGFILGCAKGANQKTTIRFTDGVNNEDILIQEMDVAITVTASFIGTRVQGWEDARIDLMLRLHCSILNIRIHRFLLNGMARNNSFIISYQPMSCT